jgi:hypothetical protein
MLTTWFIRHGVASTVAMVNQNATLTTLLEMNAETTKAYVVCAHNSDVIAPTIAHKPAFGCCFTVSFDAQSNLDFDDAANDIELFHVDLR